MFSALAGATKGVIGAVGVGLAALDAVSTGNKEELIKRQLHTEVCQAMDRYEQERDNRANRRDCCAGLANWVLVVLCLVELPVRWAWHCVVYLIFTIASGIWWPLFWCNPAATGLIAQGWTFCMLQVAHHQVHFNLYAMAFSSLSAALCGACCSVTTPWFFQHNLDLLRPADPLITRHIYEGCCLPCMRLIKEYEPVLDPQQAAARYFRSMFLFLSGCESCHPALVCGRCCACCREHYEGPVDRLTRWAQERAQERRANTARFYQEVFQAGSYEELEARRVAAYREELQRQGEGAKASGLDVARTAVGLLTANNKQGLIGNAITAASYAVGGGMVQNGQALQPTAPTSGDEADLEQGGAHGTRKQSSPPPGTSSSSGDGRKGGGAGGLLHLAAAAVQTAVEVGQEALARRQAGGSEVVAEAVPVVVAVEAEGHSNVPMAQVQKAEK